MQHSVTMAMALATLLAGWWTTTQTPEPPDTSDALRA